MEFRRYLEILGRRAPIVLVVSTLAMAVVTASGILTPPEYTARATVQALWEVGTYDLSPRREADWRLLTTYGQILQSDPLLADAIDLLAPRSSSLTTSILRKQVEVGLVPDSDIITVSVQNADPGLAQDLANTLSALLVEYAQTMHIGNSQPTHEIVQEQVASLGEEIQEDYLRLGTLQADGSNSSEVGGLEQLIERKQYVYRDMVERSQLVQSYEALRANAVKVIGAATLPTEPLSRLGRREIGLSLVLGLIGGIALALVLESLDTRIRSLRQLERVTDLPVLGSVPRGTQIIPKPGASGERGNRQSLDEAYALLSINLQAQSKKTSFQSLLITDAFSKTRKVAVAANLASATAQSGWKTLIVGADLRQPTLHEVFGLSNARGLTSVLDGTASPTEAVQASEVPNLSVLTSGPIPANPPALLSSSDMAGLVKELTRDFDLVVLESPSTVAAPDAAAMGRVVDGSILLLDQSSSTEEQIRAALKQLQTAGAQMLGLVFVKRNSRQGDLQ